MEQVTDLTFLRNFSGNDPEKIRKYIGLFLKGASPGLEQMKVHVTSGDWSALKTSAHSMKTQLKYMGAARAVDLAYTIENNAGEQKELDQIPAVMSSLEKLVTTAIGELEAELGRL
jgi:HPt (histidine-containing phosphotransfer) domain-containing protein